MRTSYLTQTTPVHIAYLRFSGSKVTTSFFIAGFPWFFLLPFVFEADAIFVNLPFPIKSQIVLSYKVQ
jgi:hypothetical protein